MVERYSPPVHPHIRGAYCGFHLSQCFLCGSSPHTWGIHVYNAQLNIISRFIPTYVGHTLSAWRWSHVLAVHPHIRGAYITPVKSAMHPLVHPHIRGAYSMILTISARISGSSPHTWGIQSQPCGAGLFMRFIPTYVGHTVIVPMPDSVTSVHPHIRGAYFLSILTHLLGFGSSPHTWGILFVHFDTSSWFRFIPTYVGHTVASATTYSLPFGSSPHTWGIQGQSGSPPLRRRFIPTYVGHTLGTTGKTSTSSVHPHIRGAYMTPPACQASQMGSSPHTWGIHMNVSY